MSARSPDTSPDAFRVQQEVWRRMGPERRLSLAVSMSEDVRALSRAGIAARHPDYDAEEVRWAEFRLHLGNDLFARAFPAAPLLDP